MGDRKGLAKGPTREVGSSRRPKGEGIVLGRQVAV